MVISNEVLLRLDQLILALETAPVLSEEEAVLRHKAFFRPLFMEMLKTGKRYGELSGTLGHLVRPDVKEYLRSIDNDLLRQIEITNESVQSWFRNGEKLAPYYPWRITVILRKNKLFSYEKKFLAAYCRHFYGIVGGRYESLSERAEKLGVAQTKA